MTGRLASATLLRDRRLLIVQRDPLIRRALERYFARLVKTVSVASNFEEADAVFNDRERTPTDLICGQEFGKNEPLGTTLVVGWRDQHAALRRVILVTGALTLPRELPGVDAVVSKPAEVSDLVTQLLAA
jgi:ActR/RegA family two-component response regulator